LTSAEYQGLLRNLRDLPADVRIVDHIEYAADSPEASAPAALPTRAAAPAPPASASRAATAVPSLTVTSEPAEANIFVNGQRQFTQTPAKIDLPPGTYRISVSKPGFEPSSSQVEIQAGQPAHVDATLSTLPAGLGWVVARTVPKGAAITVDGAPTDQQTPARLDLAPGEHLLVFALAGYTAEASIVVHPGRGSQVFQVLNRP
jgi:hypothetical protein